MAELEAELSSIPAPRANRPVVYAAVGDGAMERLRGTGGLAPVTPTTRPPARTSAFDHFHALAGREAGVEGLWIRRFVLDNPPR